MKTMQLSVLALALTFTLGFAACGGAEEEVQQPQIIEIKTEERVIERDKDKVDVEVEPNGGKINVEIDNGKNKIDVELGKDDKK